ncbi:MULTISPECIES: serine hydrolase domain-containing protein [Bacillus cereus group]|uniref:serine hydrolase domain-containing protein n=1 Tax=Bacillus cereus group TaxID=86661 RepID=UPI000BEB8189|nr:MULTISPECIES: serine hydrolase domain-containing protein [Bacillus cereus group]MBJ8097213.1 beta-lactamase family protein [Bacillus cereus group sp. N11]PDY86030.1 penicillin-binding protein [Bacillus toyonensis]PGE70016.1 penicillin-binding protein [Bacillus toyonensis]PHD40472.1 penicillin-binding protein [Bacillus toyonensis]PHD48454.1 penicillin-binding protein [Bacillus toyonensis]
MKNRQKASIICKSILCLMICIFITNEVWFTNVVRAESGTLTNRSIENFKKKMDEQVPKWQENYEVPGVAIGIVHEGRIAYTLNYGYVDKKTKKAVSDDTLFQAGSISKSLTAWGILHLVDEGRLSLDDPVGKYLTKWKLPNSEFNNNEVTIRRLLSHTAGLSAHKGYLGVVPGKHLDSIEESLSGKGWLNEPVEVTNKPGSETIYSGGGYTILQLVIEEVTGIPFDRYMEEQIMKPLGIKSSSFLQRPENHNLSKAYGYFGEELPSYQFTEQAAAGLKTNVTDMMTLILASMDANNKGNGVIKSEHVEEMQKLVLGENGLGIFEKKLSNQWKLLYHSGDNRGWHSFYGFIPNTKDGLVILTNGEGGIDLRQDIYHAWIEYETGKLPESYFSLAEQRKNNSITSIVIGATLGLYLLLFVIRLYKGRRTFIFKQEKRSYIGLVVRTFLLIITAILVFCAAYLWRVFSLNSGNTINFILIMVWIITLLISGFFPKIKSNKKQRMKRKDLTSKFTCM